MVAAAAEKHGAAQCGGGVASLCRAIEAHSLGGRFHYIKSSYSRDRLLPPSAIASLVYSGGAAEHGAQPYSLPPPPPLTATQKIQVETNDKTFSLALPPFYRVY